MINVYKIRETKGKKPGPRPVIRYRMQVKVKGIEPFNVELRANKHTENDAQQLAGILGAIVDAYNHGSKVDDKTLAFLDLFPNEKKKLTKRGFIATVKEKTLVDLWEEYERDHVDNWKPYTINHKKQGRKWFFRFFPPDGIASTLTKRDAQSYRNWLAQFVAEEKLAESTAGDHFGDAKTLFKWAFENDVLSFNPFQTIKGFSKTNSARQFYVDHDMTRKLLNVSPSKEWSALILLARRVGLRVPSESNLLRWDDVDFKSGLLTVHSPKTERHKGKDKRVVPLFPDVAEALRQLKDEQRRNGEKSPFVLPVLRGIDKNLRTHLERLVFRAGLEKWPKLFQNLRASAATDIYRRYGEKTEAEWVGHNPDVAMKHYLQVLPADIANAQEWNALAETNA